MSRRKHDYDALRREYVSTPGLSVRALCQRHDITSWSTVNAIKNKENWDEQREAYESQLAGREVEVLVERRLREVAEIHGELLFAVRAAVRRFVADISRKENPQPLSARDLMGLIDKFLLLTGQPTARSESKNLDVHDFGGLLRDAPPELLRELAEVARANGAGAKPVGRGPLVIIEGTRTA